MNKLQSDKITLIKPKLMERSHMNMPEYITFVCDLNGKILKGENNSDLPQSIFEIIDESDVHIVKQIIQNIVNEEPFTEVLKVRLTNKDDYYLHIERDRDDNIKMAFSKCDIDERCYFWNGVITRYNYKFNRTVNVIKSISDLIENVFYKNRSSLTDIIVKVCECFCLEQALLLFKNGKDHILYCKEEQCDYTADYIDVEERYDPKRYSTKDDEILITRPYVETFLNDYVNKDHKNVTVYILKLELGGKQIGFLEFIPQSYTTLNKTELDLIKSLSSIFSYIINNKLENTELETYIKEKLMFNKL